MDTTESFLMGAGVVAVAILALSVGILIGQSQQCEEVRGYLAIGGYTEAVEALRVAHVCEARR